MYMKLLVFTLLFSLSSIACLAGTPAENEEALKQTIDQWYGQIGLSGKVSKTDFNTAVRGWFHYKAKGRIPGHNIMAIVDFSISSTDKRFFIFQIGSNAKMLREEWVTHGKFSGDTFAPGKHFSNTDGSKQSSLGFMKTSENVTVAPGANKVGSYRALDGLEGSEVNSRARGREILLHGASYIGPGQGGRSWGCLAVNTKRLDPVRSVLKKGSLIYSNDGKPRTYYTFLGGNGNVTAQDIAGVPGTENDPGPDSDPNVKSFSDLSLADADDSSGPINFGSGGFGDLGSAAASPALSGMADYKAEEDGEGDNSFSEEMTNNDAKLGQAPIHGSSSFEDCQNRASAPWCEVVKEAVKVNGTPSKYFSGTWKAMHEHLGSVDNSTGAVRRSAADNNQAENERCIALAASMEKSCGCDPSNEPDQYSTFDKEIICKKQSGEDATFCDCKKLVDAYNQSASDEKNLNATELADFKAKGKSQLESIKAQAGSLQSTAVVVQQEMTTAQANIAKSRSQFQVAKLNELNRLQAAMPNRNSLLAECNKNIAGKDLGKKDLKAYLGHLPNQVQTIPVLPNPCSSVAKLMNTNLIQNIPARKQAIKAIEKAGLKALDFNGKEKMLLHQNALGRNARIGDSTASSISLGGYGKFKGSNDGAKFGFGKKVEFSGSECKGSNCNYKGSGKGALGKRRGSKGSSSFDPYSSISTSNNVRSSGSNKDSKVLTFDSRKRKRGIVDDSFYANVNLALDGRLAVSELSPAQKKEYHAVLEYRKMKPIAPSTNSRSKNRNKQSRNGAKGEGKEIWFDTGMDLFKIISNRYQKVFKNKL